MPAKSKKSKKNLPPPPPPEIVYVRSEEEYETSVLMHKGFCLVAVVTPFCNLCSRTVTPYLEKLNLERPPTISALQLVIIVANEGTEALCQSLEIVSVPTFLSLSYGKVLHRFSGDNVEKALLMARVAAQVAEEDKKAAEEAAAAAAEETNDDMPRTETNAAAQPEETAPLEG